MLAGWSSGSKYPLLGSVRASAQLISYEAAFGLAIVGVLLYSGTLSTRGIVNGQAWTSWHSFVTQWYWAPAIVAFVIFLIAAIAETNHPPFDLVEAEQELVGGFPHRCIPASVSGSSPPVRGQDQDRRFLAAAAVESP